MKLWSLGSGSKGNAILLEHGDSRLLVDAGFAPRTLAQRLQAIGVSPASISDCVITHEHGDHCRGAAAAAVKWGWRLHTTPGTLAGCPGLPSESVSTFAAGAMLSLAGMTVQTLASPHDANESVVLVVTSRAGVRVGLAYDLGHVPEAVAAALEELDLLVLESNHDEGMLRSGPYPASVRARIASSTGHLSNRAAADSACRSVNPNLSHVLLAHMSEKCNDHGVAVTGMRGALRRTAFRGQVEPLLQHAPCGPFLPRHSSVAAAAQLSLF
ncbi:MAG: MBL fold metallo-hydrolase [Gemmatimonadaceae bacterium]